MLESLFNKSAGLKVYSNDLSKIFNDVTVNHFGDDTYVYGAAK